MGHAEMFVRLSHPLAPTALLAHGHARTRLSATGAPEPPLAGPPCAHIFTMVESCFR
jgi:hypothetical protein